MAVCQVGVVVLIRDQSTLRPLSFPSYVTVSLMELWGSTKPGLTALGSCPRFDVHQTCGCGHLFPYQVPGISFFISKAQS